MFEVNLLEKEKLVPKDTTRLASTFKVLTVVFTGLSIGVVAVVARRMFVLLKFLFFQKKGSNVGTFCTGRFSHVVARLKLAYLMVTLTISALKSFSMFGF